MKCPKKTPENCWLFRWDLVNKKECGSKLYFDFKDVTSHLDYVLSYLQSISSDRFTVISSDREYLGFHSFPILNILYCSYWALLQFCYLFQTALQAFARSYVDLLCLDMIFARNLIVGIERKSHVWKILTKCNCWVPLPVLFYWFLADGEELPLKE